MLAQLNRVEVTAHLNVEGECIPVLKGRFDCLVRQPPFDDPFQEGLLFLFRFVLRHDFV